MALKGRWDKLPIKKWLQCKKEFGSAIQMGRSIFEAIAILISNFIMRLRQWISIQLLSYCTFQEIVIWAVREGMPISNFQRENCQLLNELKPNLIKSHFLQKLTRSAAIEKDSVIWNWIGILFLLSNILSALMRVIKKAAVGGSVGIIRHKPAFY